MSSGGLDNEFDSSRQQMLRRSAGLPPVLLFFTGLSTDIYGLPMLVEPDEDVPDGLHTERVLYAARKVDGKYRVRYAIGLGGITLNGGNTMSVEALAVEARSMGVTWIAPTIIAPIEEDVARVARLCNIPWASVAAVKATANKSQFRELRARHRLAHVSSRVCTSEAEIFSALKAAPGPCIVKPENGYGSLGTLRVDASQQNDQTVTAAIDLHLEERRTANCGRTLVEDFIEGEEFGVTAIVEGDEIRFWMTIRKEMTPYPFRKEVAWIFDPDDERRLQVDPLIHDDIIRTLKALQSISPASPPMRTFVNADVIVTNERAVHVVDMSLRLGGGAMVRMSNAALGVSCNSQIFDRLLMRWAAGQDVSFEAQGKPLAALARVGYPEGGRPLRPRRNIPWDRHDVFWDAFDSTYGDVVPPLQSLESAKGKPVIGVEAPDIRTANIRWNTAMAAMDWPLELSDGRVTGYDENGQWFVDPGTSMSSLQFPEMP